MSLFETLGFSSGLREEDKIRSADASSDLIKEYLKEYADIVGFKNHRAFSLKERENVYRFTLKLISLDFLSKLAKDKRVKNVFFSPSTPPPGAGMDSISMRYKIYIEYI